MRSNKKPQNKWLRENNRIPRDAPKWVCTLHHSVVAIPQNLQNPRPWGDCCPHTGTRIDSTSSFVVYITNNHAFIKTFDAEIAQLLGTDIDPNQYTLGTQPSPGEMIVGMIRNYNVIQPMALAIKLAHKLGLIGSFQRYDEIILALAEEVQDSITAQHEKTFKRYESCRNLALGTQEPNEKFLAMERAYEQGRKLINQFMSLKAGA